MFGFATRRPVAVLMMTTAAALFGVLSYQQLGLELMPDLAYPTLTIRVEYPGAAPQEVESEIVRQLESRVGTVEALVGMHSSSRAGVAEVVLEFDWNSDMDRAAQRVRERMGRLDLPDAAETPVLLRYDATLVPVLSLGVSGEGDLTLTRLRTYAEQRLAPELAKVAGVAAVRVLGGLEREVQVRLDESAIAGRGLGVPEVVARLRAANVNLAGGTLREGSVEFLVRTLAELRTPAELERIVVLQRGGALIRLGDIATVVPTTRERTSLVRVGGREAVRVDVFRQADANIVEVCDDVRDAVFGTESQRAFVANGPSEEARPEQKEGAKKGKRGMGKRMKAKRDALKRRQMTDFIAYRAPRGASIDVLGDQSVFIRASLSEVSSAALVGGLLAVLMLYLFLGSGYPTFIIALAIPLSIAVTFAPLKLFGVSLNVMSLGGLALGVGMLVDNSVVVLESIYRCREEGDAVVAAALRGTREVGAAVVASTLTTVAVFFPIVFVEGVAGQVFGDLALAVVFSLLASLLVALFVVPMLASRTFDLSAAQGAPTRWSVPIGGLPVLFRQARSPRGWVKLILLSPYGLLQTLLGLVGNLVVLLAALVGVPVVLAFRGISIVARGLLYLPTRAATALIEAAHAAQVVSDGTRRRRRAHPRGAPGRARRRRALPGGDAAHGHRHPRGPSRGCAEGPPPRGARRELRRGARGGGGRRARARTPHGRRHGSVEGRRRTAACARRRGRSGHPARGRGHPRSRARAQPPRPLQPAPADPGGRAGPRAAAPRARRRPGPRGPRGAPRRLGRALVGPPRLPRDPGRLRPPAPRLAGARAAHRRRAPAGADRG